MTTHFDRMQFPSDIFRQMMTAVCCRPVYRVIERRGRVYELWGHREHSHRKIISCAKLEAMTLEQFVTWLGKNYVYGQLLFPDPSVYREQKGEE